MAGDAVAAQDDATSAPPPRIARAAQRHRLGAPIAVRHAPNPFMAGIFSLLAALVLFGAALGVRLLGKRNIGVAAELLRFVALFAAVAMVVALAFGAATLVRGSQSYYLYAKGIVHRRGNAVRAYTWTDVRATSRDDSYYTLSPLGGRPLVIPIRGGTDEFVDALVTVLRQHGRIVG